MIKIDTDVSEILEYHQINNKINNIIALCASGTNIVDEDIIALEYANVSFNPIKIGKSVRRLMTYVGQILKQIIQAMVDLGRFMVRVISNAIKPVAEFLEESKENLDRYFKGDFGDLACLAYQYSLKNPGGTIMNLFEETDKFYTAYDNFLTNTLEPYLLDKNGELNIIDKGLIINKFQKEVFSEKVLPTIHWIGKRMTTRIKPFFSTLQDVGSSINTGIYGSQAPYKRMVRINTFLTEPKNIDALSESSLRHAQVQQKALRKTGDRLRKLSNTIEASFERAKLGSVSINQVLGQIRLIGAMALHLPTVSWNIFYGYRTDIMSAIKRINEYALAGG